MALNRTQYLLLATAAVLVAVASFWIWGDWLHTFGVSIQHGLPTKIIQVGGAPVVVELPTTAAEQEQGLGGRTALPEGRGMLFNMGQDGEWPFWMKGMQFAIDIVWLADDGTVVYIAPDVAPSTYLQDPPEVFKSNAPARYVLELPAGYMAAIGVGTGDKIVL